MRVCIFYVDPVYCSRDLQVRILINFSSKLDPMTLFTHLKIIFLQCFQFSTIGSIQTDPKSTRLKNDSNLCGIYFIRHVSLALLKIFFFFLKAKQVWKLVKFFHNTYILQTNMIDAISEPMSCMILIQPKKKIVLSLKIITYYIASKHHVHINL